MAITKLPDVTGALVEFMQLAVFPVEYHRLTFDLFYRKVLRLSG